MKENQLNLSIKINNRARAGSLINALSSPVGFGMDAKNFKGEVIKMKSFKGITVVGYSPNDKLWILDTGQIVTTEELQKMVLEA